MRRASVLVGALVLLAMIGGLLALRPTLERLVSPGPLRPAHAKIETRCGACHFAFTPTAENGKCMVCHTGVGGDIRSRTGFHGRTPAASKQQCRVCHLEHQGAVRFATDLKGTGFDHGKTDFPLHGQHRGLPCTSCHKGGAKFRAAPAACVACHVKDDVHQTRFGRNCASCHSESGWKNIHKFDHAATGFRLVGAHQATACASCHAGNRFAGTPTQCVGCHLADDVHDGRNGTDCASCHTQLSWKGALFDHGRTRFPLVGQHRTVTCTACHGARNERLRPSMQCAACHRKDDVHKGTNGSNCATCHSPASWKGAFFDHDKATRFPLLGAHKRVRCATCHVKPVHSFKPARECAGCHARQDPHQGKLGRNCAACHTQDRWRPAPGFHHAATRFPLTGAHVRTACTDCHQNKQFRAAGVTCASCHADIAHKGRFGTPARCETCHTTARWTGARFDHDRTGFSLTGRHARLSCNSCHTKPATTARLPVGCYGCHKADDHHDGRFGTKCETCHVSGDSFRTVRVPATARRHPDFNGRQLR